MHQEPVDPESLNREDWNSLLNNYDKHDIGEAYLRGRVNEMGLHAEQWGIDRRHEDDGLIYDEKMDLRLWEPLNGQSPPERWPENTTHSWHRTEAGQYSSFIPKRPSESWRLRAIADVKTKSNEDWMGVCNLRHYAHYASWADEYDVPVFIYFTMVDVDDQSVGERNVLVPVRADWDFGLVEDNFDSHSPISLEYSTLVEKAEESAVVDRVFEAPDYNVVVAFDEDEWRNFNWLAQELR